MTGEAKGKARSCEPGKTWKEMFDLHRNKKGGAPIKDRPKFRATCYLDLLVAITGLKRSTLQRYLTKMGLYAGSIPDICTYIKRWKNRTKPLDAS